MTAKHRTARVSRRVVPWTAASAESNRSEFHKRAVYVANLIGSPGCGKTALLEATLRKLALRAAVIEGDIRTSLDAERIRATGTPAVQIETGGACHLDPAMVARAVAQLDLSALDVLFIENVGNLVCPAGVDLGEDIKVAVTSVPEGDEKPAKYPALFIRAAAVVINKIDLLPHVDYSLERATADCRKVNHRAEVFPLSCTTGQGIDAWVAFLQRVSRRSR